ncbi:MAG: phosphate ABC transporter substrate-binding protein PstS [Acidimicrobiales bacterium]
MLALLVLAACGDTSDIGGGTDDTQVESSADSPCGKGGTTANLAPSGIAKLQGGANSLSGAGATFPAPIYSLWSGDYKKSNGVEVAYQSIGSGGGVKQISEQTVDFGASDAPMKDSELALAKGGQVLHIPTVFGAVVPTYNVSGQTSGLHFTGEALGKVFAGKVTKWNDPELVELNPDAKLPDLAIAVVHRSDGSGTTDIWTDYLTKTSPTWTQSLGGPERSRGKEVAWPVGIGGKGNEGVSGAVSQTQGALGYVELAYALEQKLPVGQVANRAGTSVQPCIETVTAAAAGAQFPADLRFSLTDAAGETAYPVSGATWLLVYENQTDEAKAKALVNYLAWIMDEGQKSAPTLNYAPLSAELRTLAIAQIKKVKVNGKPLA